MAKVYLEPNDVQQIENSATNLRDRLLIRILFRIGCRVSEALSLATKDIDFVHKTITIQHLKIRLNLSC